jgi:hypothetical protein
MSQETQGRLDVLILRLAEEFGHRVQAKTQVDIRASLMEIAENVIEDLEIPRTSIDANTVVRSLLRIPDRRCKVRRVR